MEYEVQFAKLATREKLPDRFLTIQHKFSSDLTKTQMGEVFVLIEILTPWFPTNQVGQHIITTFSDSYFSGGSTSDIVNFEEALKKVNEKLAQITQNGDTEWIGNLNAILGVVVENKIHIAQAGKSEAYIFRDGKVNHLTYGLSQNGFDAHPLKTFSNITSGELKAQDKILIANPDIYKNFTIESLRQVITLNNPGDAVLQLAKMLKKKRVSNINAIVINLLSSEEMAKKPGGSEPITVYLDKPLESVWAGSKRMWQQILQPVLQIFAKSSKEAGAKSVDFTKKYLAALKEKKQMQNSEPLKKKDLFEKEFLSTERDDSLLKDEEIKYSPELDIHYYNESKEKNENSFSKIFKKIIPFLTGFTSWFMQTVHNKKKRPYLFCLP